MGCLSWKQWLWKITRLVFKLSGVQRHCFSATDTTHARLPSADFLTEDNPLEFVCSQRQRHRCVSRTVGQPCRCLQGDGGIRGRRRSFSTMRALRIYCPASATGQKNGRLHEQRLSFMQWRTTSQGEPCPELNAECFIYSCPRGQSVPRLPAYKSKRSFKQCR